MLNDEITIYLNKLTEKFPSIQSIWLIGSRVTGNCRPDSDWDLLVFGSQETLNGLRLRHEFNKDNIDLLVVFNGNDFESPWASSGGKKKHGSLSDWQWKFLKPEIAFYWGTKGITGDDGEEQFNVEMKLEQANRIYP